ncbi:MAG: DUF3553 domain-containing protein [Phycisphaerales bacterium]|nr:DUF3553 domain-containing protein [Phycisphaerales bacterium]
MPSTLFKKGDRVRHPRRPEWGIGTVTRVEHVTHTGAADSRVWVRFPSMGEKTFLAGAAELEEVAGEAADAASSIYSRPSIAEIEANSGAGWLGKADGGKIAEAMTAVPLEATDPFLSIRKRLENTLALYRFDQSAAKLIDWAVAQSGLDDPLSRFNRQELEQLHQRWIFKVDTHLTKLLGDARREPGAVDSVAASASPSAQRAVKRLMSMVR